MESIKPVKVLLDQGKIGNVVLLVDEIYFQKDAWYQGGKLVAVESEGNLVKGVMTFMINSLKQSIPFAKVKIEGFVAFWTNWWIYSYITWDRFYYCGSYLRQSLHKCVWYTD